MLVDSRSRFSDARLSTRKASAISHRLVFLGGPGDLDRRGVVDRDLVERPDLHGADAHVEQAFGGPSGSFWKRRSGWLGDLQCRFLRLQRCSLLLWLV